MKTTFKYALVINTIYLLVICMALGAPRVQNPSDWKWSDIMDSGDLTALNGINASWWLWDFNQSTSNSLIGLNISWSYIPVYQQGRFLGYDLQKAGKVTGLSIEFGPYFQLSGAIPSEIGDLTDLQGLYLRGNQFSGAIPPQIGYLVNLQYLALSLNRLSGVIPPEIGNLSKLEWLDLSVNQLSGAIPPQIGYLVNLQYLALSANRLSGMIPPEIGNLTELQFLDLGSNQLSGAIPSQIGNLLNLEDFSVADNLLAGNIPSGLLDGSLLLLDVSYNNFDPSNGSPFSQSLLELRNRGVFVNNDSQQLEELAQLSSLVYIGSNGWNEYYYAGDAVYNGFRAAVYVNDTSAPLYSDSVNKVVIAFRGTDSNVDNITTIMNIAADVGFGRYILPTPSLIYYCQYAADMLLEVKDHYPNAAIILTGHSLGGGIAQILGAASGLPAYAFNAPGAGSAYPSILPIMTDVAGMGSGGTNVNYRLYGEQISLFGSAVPGSSTVTLPWPADTHWVRDMLPPIEFITNFSNGRIDYLHGISAVISQILEQPTNRAFEPNDATAIEDTVWLTHLNGVTFDIASIASLAPLIFPSGIDPSATDIILSGEPGSPSFHSFILAPTILKSTSGVAFYAMRYKTGNTWSAFSLVKPNDTISFGAGANAVEIVPMNLFGNPVSLAGFFLEASFVSSGTATINFVSSNTAPSLSPFQTWQVAKFGPNAAVPSIAGAGANPSGDGVANLVKYALGMDPMRHSMTGLPVPKMTKINGSTYLSIAYGKNNFATDVTFHPEWSTNLSSWSSVGIVEQIVSDNGTVKQVQDSVSLNASQPMFMRLRVTMP